MHGKHMKYLLVAAGALVVGLLAAGSPLQTVLPYLLLLACPLMMVFMMRGMGGHGSHSAGNDNASPDSPARDNATAGRDDATTPK